MLLEAGEKEAVELWETIAAALLEETGLDAPPIDAFDLATICELVPVPWRGTEAALGPEPFLWYPGEARPQRQHGLIAHELGHWALDWAGEDDSELGASYIGGALLLPRRAFDRDLQRTAWDFAELRRLHVNASAEVIARRITQTRDAVITVIDQGRVKARIISPWLTDPRLSRVSKWELDLAQRAVEHEATIHGDEYCYAVPVIDPPWRRVVVVCEAHQLARRS